MQTVAILTLFLVATAAATASSQQEPQQQQQQASSSSQVESAVPVVAQQAPSAVVVGEAPAVAPPVSGVEHHSQQPGQQGASYYAPAAAGVIQVVGESNKPGSQVASGPVRTFGQAEQYGQPESASMPANYKPFGSWGLYIGGNPADGYYTNYYKQLSSSVSSDKQQVVTPAAALSPMLRQAGSSPYVGADYYPFAYSPADFNFNNQQPAVAAAAGRPYGYVEPAAPTPAGHHHQAHYAPAGELYGVQPSVYADQYSLAGTKRVGSAPPMAAGTKQQQQQQEQVQQVQQVQQQRELQVPAKGRHYANSVVGHLSAPGVASAVVGSQQPTAQVVAYPVPVGSQIVGSQQGVDGAFAPYGVHAFTRYAVKPAVVPGQPAEYYYPGQPAYKQPSAYYHQPSPVAYYGHQPNHHYNHHQLHYANQPAPVEGPYFGPPVVQPEQFGAVVEKPEVANVDDRSPVKPQK